MIQKKIGRNDPCHCGSGKKYKYCHYGIEKERIVKTELKCDDCDINIDLDLTKSFISNLTSGCMPLKIFCKENGFYCFGFMSAYDSLELIKKLENNSLKKEDFFECYKNYYTYEKCKDFLRICCQENENFQNRQKIIEESIDAHFNSKFTLSIPIFFTLIEGVLREVFGINKKDNFQPKFDRDMWNRRFLFGVADDVDFLSGYINLLFEGSAAQECFNRNTILHGLNYSYNSEENSWSLLLLLSTIGSLKLLEKQTKPFTFKKGTNGIEIVSPNIDPN